MQAAESGKRHRRRPGRRRATRDGGTPKRAVRAELVCLPPRASGLTPRPSPSRGEGRPRGQVIVSMILRVIQRDQRSWMRACRRHKLSPPLTNLSAIERKHNSTSCALWSLPRIFSFCAPVGGGPAHKSVCFLHADACPTHPDLPASVCQHACISVVPFPRMLATRGRGHVSAVCPAGLSRQLLAKFRVASRHF